MKVYRSRQFLTAIIVFFLSPQKKFKKETATSNTTDSTGFQLVPVRWCPQSFPPSKDPSSLRIVMVQ